MTRTVNGTGQRGTLRTREVRASAAVARVPGMIASTRARMLEDLTSGGRIVERTREQARTLRQALCDAIRANKAEYTMRQNWEKGASLDAHDKHWIQPGLSAHGVSVPGTTEKARACAIKYDFMPYTIVEDGVQDMARTILRLEIPAPRDPLLPPPGLTSEQVIDDILRMTRETG